MNPFLEIAYYSYNLYKTDYKKIASYSRYAANKSNKRRIVILVDCFISSFRCEMSPIDFFQFRLFEQTYDQRRAWAGTTYMYKAQASLVPDAVRDIFRNKEKFNYRFLQFLDKRKIVVSGEKAVQALRQWIDKEGLQCFVTKPINGQCGVGVRLHEVKRKEGVLLVDSLAIEKFVQGEKSGFIAEALLVNHDTIRQVNPTCLNTLRLVTFIENDGNVRIIAARIRFGRGRMVDNLAAGGIAAPVDAKSGVVTGGAVSSSPEEEEAFEYHPITGESILGFQIPYWKESIDLVREAAKIVPAARSIGWDVAITQKGPVLIEGNHNWCKTLWQLPLRRGLRHEMEAILSAVSSSRREGASNHFD